ncbi:MAG TPA: DUF2634 domain-containing protein [Pseudoneobacillus sp.]|nr:DUF2634 domain-containing protein [Pseudoneobacillus sp.]
MLRPLIFTQEELDNVNKSNDIKQVAPSKTYRFDMTTGEIYAEWVDHDEAIRQMVVKTIKTMRDKYLIYSSDYGCEIFYLLGSTYSQEYLELEIPRLIDEALMVDDRIKGTTNYTITRVGNDINVSFEVLCKIINNVVVEVVL